MLIMQTLPLIFYLQESQTTVTGSYVVYAPVDLFTMNSVLSGDDPGNVQILASGFAVLPDRPRIGGEENCGTLLTIAIRVVDQHSSTPEYLPPTSVLTVYTIITQTVQLIRAAITQWCTHSNVEREREIVEAMNMVDSSLLSFENGTSKPYFPTEHKTARPR